MDARPLNLARPEVPVELAALVAKMMAKEPERRFQTPKEVAQALTPFFKKGSVASTGSKPEFSQAGQPEAKPAAAGAGSVPARHAAEFAPAPAPPGSTPAQRLRPEPTWESLVDLKETEPVKQAAPAVASNRRPPWLWPAVAAAVLVLGLLAVWGTGVLKIKTPEGFIVLKDLPDQAMVLIDGKKATVHWPDSGGPAEITAPPGEHVVQVKKDGFTMKGQRVTVETRGKTTLIVELEPLETSPPKKGGDGHARSVAPKPPAPPVTGAVATTAPTSPQVPAANSNTNPTVAMDNKAGKVDAAGRVANEPARPQAIDAARALLGKAEILSGRWLVEGRELVQTDAAEGHIGNVVFGDVTWTDYDFEAEMKREKENGDNSAGLSFRRTLRNENNIFFVITPDDCGVYAAEDGKYRLLKGAEVHPCSQKWYHARASIRGRHFVCKLGDEDEKELVHLNFEDDRHPLGQVAIFTEGCSYRFRNIKVTAPDGKTLWEMPPALGEPPMPPAKMYEKRQASTRLAPAFTSEKGKKSQEVVNRPAGPVPEKKMLPPAVILSGSWRVNGQELVQSDLDRAGTILLGDKELSSYDLKFQGQIVAGNEGFVALFHRTDDNNVRFFHVGELRGKRVDLGFLHGGKEGVQSKPISTVKGRWYKVWVKVRGAECRCYLDGQMLLHDVDKRFTKGRIGLATWDANARYRDIVITTPEGKVVWSGLPQLPGN